MKNQKKQHLKGFSLVELLVTMAFLSVIVFGVIKLETSNLGLANTQNLQLKANLLANQAIAIVESLGVEGIDAAGCAQWPCIKKLSAPPYALQDNDEIIDEIGFARTIQITPIGVSEGKIQTLDAPPIQPEPPEPPIPTAYKVSAMINWTDTTGPHTFTINRIIY